MGEPRRIKAGLAGKVLRVDLSTGRIWTEETLKYAQRWIGGRTINSYILFNEMQPGTKWSDPDNLLIFGAGCLVGTTLGANRLSIDTKNVFSNGKGSANVGGHFAAELKFAGFDHIVISGKARKPVYLWVCDGQAELRDAGALWGRTTYETEALLHEELGDRKVRVACIGPAGENLVMGSAILFDLAKAAAGSGVGCVMGSKNLKAVAVRGHGSLQVADPEAFLRATDVALTKVKASPDFEPMARMGLAFRHTATGDPCSSTWEQGRVFRNGQDEYVPIEKRKQLVDKDGIPAYRRKMLACFACPVGCMLFCKIPEGKYEGVSGEGFWENTLILGTMLDVSKPDALLAAWLRMNALGLDADFATVMIAWAFECWEKGLLTAEMTDGLRLEWGNADAVVELTERLAYRQGIGDLLAKGPIEASRELGHGSDYFAIHVKGQPSLERFRVPRGWALGIATSPVAGRHLRGAAQRAPKGVPYDPLSYENQAKFVHWMSLVKEIEDTIGMCVYLGPWSGVRALELSDYLALTNAVMGLDLTEAEFMRFAAKGRNLETAFNALHTDLGRVDDYPPARYMEEPIASGPFKGRGIDREKYDQMLDEFYEVWCWDKETGHQTDECLAQLDMADIAARLDEAGKLVVK
jgi:aldehyde:ferredoxin oxidoreductase